MAGAEPCHQVPVVGKGSGHAGEVVDALGPSLGDVRGGPSMDVADVSNEVTHAPPRTGRDRHVQIRPLGRGGDRLPRPAERVEVDRGVQRGLERCVGGPPKHASLPRSFDDRTIHEAEWNHIPVILSLSGGTLCE